MQREIDHLRRQLQIAKRGNGSGQDQTLDGADPDQSINPRTTKSRQLGDILLPGETVDDLFKQ